jgi:hypothetical protein
MIKLKLTAEEDGEPMTVDVEEKIPMAFECEEEDMVTALEKVALFATEMVRKIDPERWESRIREGVERRNRLN